MLARLFSWLFASLLLLASLVLGACQAPGMGDSGLVLAERLPERSPEAPGPGHAASLHLLVGPAREAHRQAGYRVAYLQRFDWERADATLVNADARIPSQVRSASATVDASDRRTAQLTFSPVEATSGYTLTVSLQRRDPAGNWQVIASGSSASFALAVGANNASVSLLPTGQGQLQLSTPVSNLPGDLAGNVTTAAGTGSASDQDGSQATAAIDSPDGLAWTLDGNLIVCERNGNRVRLLNRAAGPGSSAYVTTLAGTGVAGSLDGALASATLNGPVESAMAASGTIYVSEFNGNRIRQIATNLPTSSPGYVTTLIGSGAASSIDGPRATATVNQPAGIRFDASGTKLYVAGFGGNRIRCINLALSPGDPAFVTTVAGNGTAGSSDGSASTASFNAPAGLAFDELGNLYVSELNGNRVRKIALGLAPTSPGFVSTIAGSGAGASADGAAANASFNGPAGLAYDGKGRLYVAEFYGHCIRCLNLWLPPGDARFVTTVAGRYTGYADGSATNARFNQPEGLAFERSGALYVGDESNNRVRLVR